ncbi:methionyl-tRNA formyltransferase [Oceanispirochaeta sp.]|jgi:methionyl-tRNA formyltransferase|uniref:methionyl-tRNA formyltransferase n=1 Tax=Oceanispirochaeta sp. TaxID=2035350 RepID=UPI002639B8AA|nr:methionyl-tRNA formyltransferase [Oceanispirochaeta sp.]MDA3955748.1 methionyl-tRNA formyltransferase [Oceanispirochaeta sp.]
MRILFAGTPDIAVPSLNALAFHYDIAGVLTNPDKARGRGKQVQFSPVKKAALELGLPVFQPSKLTADFREEIQALSADLLVCLAYGKIFSQTFMDLFPKGGINLHPSGLPDLRGPSPLNSLILRGDRVGAITIQSLAKEMDSGDILLQVPLVLEERETTASLSGRVAHEGADCLLQVLRDMEAGNLKPVPQDHNKATYCSLIGKDDGLMDWSQSAEQLDRVVRAYTPWPHGFTFWKNLRLNILEARPYEGSLFPPGTVKVGEVAGLDKKDGILIQTGEGLLAVTRLQLQSKKALDHKSFINGSKDFVGSVLGEEHDL